MGLRSAIKYLLQIWPGSSRKPSVSTLSTDIPQLPVENGASRLDDIAGYSLSIGRFDLARDALVEAACLGPLSSQRTYELGISYLFEGQESEALPWLRDAIGRERRFAAPYHDNGGWPYIQSAQEEAFGDDKTFYDAYNYAGQYVLHVGDGQHRPRLHQRAFELQEKLRAKVTKPNAAVLQYLADRNMALDRLRILPFEWASQIGHLGMLDVLMKMKRLGWWSGDAILVVPRSRISNEAFLRILTVYWSFEVVTDDGSELALGLLDLIRSHGLPYYAWKLPDGQFIPWHEAGALALREYEKNGIQHDLWQAYDRLVSEEPHIRDEALSSLRSWGIAPGEEFVCLHIRESSFYGVDRERSDSGPAIRNADPANYEAMIRDLTGRGIFVIKMGAENSPVMPETDRFIDYARSRFKSPDLDLYLIRHAKYFVGTTSGLVNVAVSFDRPAAVVNCITTESQLWHAKARFLPKILRDADGNILTWARMTGQPLRWAASTVETMRRYGLTAVENSPEEILEAALAVEKLAQEHGSREDDAVLERWKASLDPPHNYGCGLPVIAFLERHTDMFDDMKS